jgi:hypothetical protein
VKQAKLRELRRQGRGQCKRRQRKGCRRRDEQGGRGLFMSAAVVVGAFFLTSCFPS